MFQAFGSVLVRSHHVVGTLDCGPQFSLPPDEFCRGVSPRKAANSRGPEKTETSCTLAAIADAVIGPILGTLIKRRAVASAFVMAWIVLSLWATSSSRTYSWRTSGISAVRTHAGTMSLFSATRAARARALLGPCAVSSSFRVGAMHADRRGIDHLRRRRRPPIRR